MAIFFAVVGLEISREATTGDLRDKRTVAVPALGALGGLLVPVLIYLAFNGGTDAAHGWGVVMSTDTAFLVGILALFGPKCPDRLRLFLLTLAIVDDIGAITVMSIFYTDEVDMAALALAGGDRRSGSSCCAGSRSGSWRPTCSPASRCGSPCRRRACTRRSPA